MNLRMSYLIANLLILLLLLKIQNSTFVNISIKYLCMYICSGLYACKLFVFFQRLRIYRKKCFIRMYIWINFVKFDVYHIVAY